jgi:outer membrane biosynthesis protein TonB
MKRDPVTTHSAADRYTNSGVALSLLLHASIIGVAYVGMPFMKRDLPIETPPLIVDLVPIEDITSAPPPPAPEPSPDPAPVIPPEPNLAAEAPSADNMPPPPKFEIAQEKPPAPKPKPPPPKPSPAKPKTDDVAMLQKLLKDMQKNAPKQQQAAPQVKSAETSNNVAPNLSDRATMTELDAIRRHIEACWRIDPGKEGLENLSAQIRVFINPDGSARAEIIDMARYFADSAFRTFANSARNAVLGCGNIPISKEHYNELKEIEMNFSPQGRIN